MKRVNRLWPDEGAVGGAGPSGGWRMRPARVLVAASRLALDSAMDQAPALTPKDFVAAIRSIAATSDRAAFAMLFAHFAPRVKAYLMRLGAEPSAAEDLMQDVMLTVWRRAESYDPTLAGVSTWIFTVARNRRIDALRREKRPELDPSDPAFAADAPRPADDAVAAQQWESKLAAAIRDLPAEQSALLRLAYFEDRSHSDIAAALRLPLGTVKSRLRLAIARLRTRFEEER